VVVGVGPIVAQVVDMVVVEVVLVDTDVQSLENCQVVIVHQSHY
jgi:hypothetical protein